MTPTSLAPDLVLTERRDARVAARALAEGAVVAHGFANVYAITTRPDAATVRSMNLLKGRPPHQVGSITTTPSRLPLLFDLTRLPAALDRRAVLALMDALFELGPFGFRGPAARHVPDHLTEEDAGVRTAQVIAPGYACPSNAFIGESLAAIGDDLLHITSATCGDEPSHYRADGVRADFGRHPGFTVLEHADEATARERYPRHDPMSTTILAFHKLGRDQHDGRLQLVLERHGSLPASDVRAVVRAMGLDLVAGPKAMRRLHQREYREPS